MTGGAIMISDMFNSALKARVDVLCNELSALVQREPGIATAESLQSQSQNSRADVGGVSSSLLAGLTIGATNWWPANLGAPSSVGAQNEIRYAYFPAARRLAVDLNGRLTVYDTQDHQISGFSQQQPGSALLSFSSQLGTVDVSRPPSSRARREPRACSNQRIRPSQTKRPRQAEALPGMKTFSPRSNAWPGCTPGAFLPRPNFPRGKRNFLVSARKS
jgi:hypothetical protein